MRILIALLLIFTALTLFYNSQPELIRTDPPPIMERPPIDPNRQVISFDWDNFKYIYKDQVNETYVNHTNPDAYIADYTVVISGQSIPTTAYTPDKYIIIGNKRYLYQLLPDGNIQLRKSR